MKEILKLILEHKLTPNQVAVLVYFRDKEAPPIKDLHTDRRLLISGEWIDDENNLLTKAHTLVDQLNSMVKTKIKKTGIQPVNVDWDNVDKYIELFPKGLLPSGKPARVGKTTLMMHFTWFFAHYAYSWDTVLKATEFYINEFEPKNFLYMRNSQYFISKTGIDKVRTSDLADYCEMIINGEANKQSHHFSEKVV